MTHSYRLSPIVILLVPVLVAAAPASLAGQQPRPEGEWQLLPAPADSLPPPSPPPLPANPSGPGIGPPMAGGPDGGMGPGRRPGGPYMRDLSEKDVLRMRQTIRLGHRAPVTVRISAAERILVTIDSAGLEQRWPIGRRSATVPADSSSGAVETSVRWKGDALVVEHRVDGGGKVRESYGVGLDGARMVVFVEIDAGIRPIVLRRQYRRPE